jgi:hypothetical protein
VKSDEKGQVKYAAKSRREMYSEAEAKEEA